MVPVMRALFQDPPPTPKRTSGFPRGGGLGMVLLRGLVPRLARRVMVTVVRGLALVLMLAFARASGGACAGLGGGGGAGAGVHRTAGLCPTPSNLKRRRIPVCSAGSLT